MSYFDHMEELDNVRPDAASLSTLFAKIMTSPHNQHALIRIVGRAGKGKSWAGLSLAAETARKVAEIKGGTEEDYFTPKNDLGVMSKPEIMRVMKNPKPYTIKFLDDVAVAWNARNYKDKFNIDLNDLIQTFRPNHNLVIMTLQSGFLIDKVPRSLIHYQAEMAESMFDQGFSLLKVFELSLSEDNGKIYKHYLQGGGTKYVRHRVMAPPEDVTNAYEIERATQLKRMAEQKAKDLEEIIEVKEEKVSGFDKILGPAILKLKGLHPHISQQDIADHFAADDIFISQKTVCNILKKHNLA